MTERSPQYTLAKKTGDLIAEKNTIIETIETLHAREIAAKDATIARLRQWLGVVLDQVDYTRGACSVTEMVGAVLDKKVIEQARAELERTL